MAIIVLPSALTDGTSAIGSQVLANDTTIANDYNGNITNANLAANAAIADTKLAQIVTAGKVSWTAVTGFTGQSTTGAIIVTIGNRSDTPSTGIVGDIYVPFACTLTGNTLLADQSGSIVIDIWKIAYASYPSTVTNTITASALPTLSSAITSQDSTLTGWTTSISSGDTLRFNVNSATTVTQVVLALKYTRV